MSRLILALVALASLAAVFACGGDDDGDGNGEATPTRLFHANPLSDEEVLAELDEIIELIRNAESNGLVGEFELQTRIRDSIDGTRLVPGLNEVSEQLLAENRILTGEYLHNTLVRVIAPPFSDADATTIDADEMEEIDPFGSFARRGEDFEVSSIFEEPVRRIIQLWYRI